MMRMFQDLVTSPERKLTAIMEGMGGKKVVLEDEHAMETLAEEEFVIVAPDPESRRDRRAPFNFVELQQEIRANPDDAIQKNAESFNRKFVTQKEQIVKEITLALSQEGSRIISATTAGPHDRVVDPVLYQVFDLCMTQTLPVAIRIYVIPGRTW